MPDLFAHFASGYLISREAHLRKYTALLVFGAVLPDVLTRVPEIVLERFIGVSVFHFFIIFHSPFCLLLTSIAISLILESRIRLLGFFLILLGSYLHVALDLMQIQLGQGVYLPYFPFSFETLQWSLFHINASILLFPALLILVLAVWRLTR